VFLPALLHKLNPSRSIKFAMESLSLSARFIVFAGAVEEVGAGVSVLVAAPNISGAEGVVGGLMRLPLDQWARKLCPWKTMWRPARVPVGFSKCR
jgi:hypothetical protein